MKDTFDLIRKIKICAMQYNLLSPVTLTPWTRVSEFVFAGNGGKGQVLQALGQLFGSSSSLVTLTPWTRAFEFVFSLRTKEWRCKLYYLSTFPEAQSLSQLLHPGEFVFAGNGRVQVIIWVVFWKRKGVITLLHIYRAHYLLATYPRRGAYFRNSFSNTVRKIPPLPHVLYCTYFMRSIVPK
mgnify:CR=1 FL=1